MFIKYNLHRFFEPINNLSAGLINFIKNTGKNF